MPEDIWDWSYDLFVHNSLDAEKLYLTIRAWPTGVDAPGIVRVLTQAGLGAYECNQLVRRPPPFLLGRITRQFAAEQLPRMQAGGVDALLLRGEQFEELPDPLAAKRLMPALGSPKPLYAVEPWRGETTALALDEVVLIVRATVLQQTTRTEIDAAPRGLYLRTMDPELAVAHSIIEDVTDTTPGAGRTTTTSTGAAEVADLFRLDGSRIRINSQKFNFDVLGNLRGRTGRENMDQLMLRLSEEAANAQIDLEFVQFRAPPGLGGAKQQMDVGGGKVTKTDHWPVFEFYSAWKYFLMRVECGLEP